MAAAGRQVSGLAEAWAQTHVHPAPRLLPSPQPCVSTEVTTQTPRLQQTLRVLCALGSVRLMGTQPGPYAFCTTTTDLPPPIQCSHRCPRAQLQGSRARTRTC